MDKALRVAKLIAYVAETIMATVVVADAVSNFSERKKSRKSDDKKKPAEDAVPSSN